MSYTHSEITCPKCKTKMPRYTGARAQYFSCISCYTFFSDKNHVIKVEGDFVKKMTARIPLGAVGRFDGIDFTVVGLLIGKEISSFHYWNEYILYNPDLGYITLSEYEGHWNIVQQIAAPKKLTNDYSYEDKRYTLFNSYNMFYASAQGEFTFDLIPKQDTEVTEYIAPPHSLLKEKYEGRVDWHQATYVSPKEVRDAFKASTKVNTASPRGTYSNQPNPYAEKSRWVWIYGLAFLMLLAVFAILQDFINPAQRVFSETLPIDTVSRKSTTAKSYVSNDFVLKSAFGYSSLRLAMSAPIDNTWVDAEINLINQQTDDEYNTEVGVEYYHGYEGGENWSEGSNTEDKILSMVPDGTYKLSITPHTEYTTNVDGDVTFKTALYAVHIDQSTSITSNYVWIILLVLAYPIYVSIRSGVRESNRWGNTDYGN